MMAEVKVEACQEGQERGFEPLAQQTVPAIAVRTQESSRNSSSK
ncbi:hypothetical protein ES706_06750 [subsurface metagenome]